MCLCACLCVYSLYELVFHTQHSVTKTNIFLSSFNYNFDSLVLFPFIIYNYRFFFLAISAYASVAYVPCLYVYSVYIYMIYIYIYEIASRSCILNFKDSTQQIRLSLSDSLHRSTVFVRISAVAWQRIL